VCSNREFRRLSTYLQSSTGLPTFFDRNSQSISVPFLHIWNHPMQKFCVSASVREFASSDSISLSLSSPSAAPPSAGHSAPADVAAAASPRAACRPAAFCRCCAGVTVSNSIPCSAVAAATISLIFVTSSYIFRGVLLLFLPPFTEFVAIAESMDASVFYRFIRTIATRDGEQNGQFVVGLVPIYGTVLMNQRVLYFVLNNNTELSSRHVAVRS